LTVIRFLFEADQKQWLQKDQSDAAEIFKAWHGYKPELTSVRPALRETIARLFEQRKAKPGDPWIARADSDSIKRPLSVLRRKLTDADAVWVPPLRDLKFGRFRLTGV